MEDKRGSWPSFRVGSCSNAAKLRQLSQALPQCFIFRQVGNSARVVLEITHQAPRQVFPSGEIAVSTCIKYYFQQVTLLTTCYLLYLLLNLKHFNSCIVPGMQEPQPIKRVCGI